MSIASLREAPALPEIDLLGVGLHSITEEQCVEHILGELSAGRGGTVVTPNLDHLRRLCRDVEFRDLCERASLRVADGRPLIWASKLQRTPLPGVVAGSNLIHSLSRAAGERELRVFFLGGDPGTADDAAEILSRRHPGLVVAGTSCPEFGFDRDESRMAELVREVRASRADIVFVALGSPKQEKLIERLRDELPEAWWLGIGISFSFVSGAVKRAPRWMQKTGLEWVHRLTQEPRRLARRYLIDGLPFALYLLSSSFFRGLRGSDS